MAPNKWAIKFLAHDQQMILYWGSLVGYCGTVPGMPVCFLAGPMDKLSVSEKAEALAFVMEQVGEVKRTRQVREAWDELEHRGYFESDGHGDQKGSLS